MSGKNIRDLCYEAYVVIFKKPQHQREKNR